MKRGWIEPRAGVGGFTFRARYWVVGPTGQPVARSKSFRVSDHPSRKAAEAAADRHLAEVLVDTARGTFVAPTEMTVGALVAAYLDGKSASVRASTMISQQGHARHIPPTSRPSGSIRSPP